MSISSESGSELVLTPTTPGSSADPLSALLSSPPAKRVRLDSEADESSDPITPTTGESELGDRADFGVCVS